MLKLLWDIFVFCFIFGGWVFFFIAAIGWLKGDEVFPVWLILFCLSLFSYLAYRAAKKAINESGVSTKIADDASKRVEKPVKIDEEEIKRFVAERERIKLLDEQSHEFILALCQAKNIRIWRELERRYSGHADIPEVWKFEKDLPLTEEEFRRFEAFDNLKCKFAADASGRRTCVLIERISDWFWYQSAE